MMNFTFENQGTNTYLTYEIQPEDTVDSMSLGMLTNNKISGLAQTLFMQIDTKKYIKYNVSAKVSAKQFFQGPVNKKRLLGVFMGIVDAMLAAEDYMIDTNTILLDLEYIFADVTTCETVLICLPVQELERKNEDIVAFFKNIVFTTQFDQTENCDHVAKILNYLNSTPVFSLQEFKAILGSVDNQETTAQQSIVQKQPVVPAQEPQKPQTNVESSQVQKQTTQQSQVDMGQMQQSQVHMGQMQQQATQQQMHQGVQQQRMQQQMQGGQSNMQVPPKGMKGAPANTQRQPQQQQTQMAKQTEKPMSMMYLLQHYNKENAAIYKAQKEAKKNAGKQVPVQQAKPQTKQAPNLGYAIPGQQPSPTMNNQQTMPPRQPAAQTNSRPMTGNPAMTMPQRTPAVPSTPQQVTPAQTAPAPQTMQSNTIPQGQYVQKPEIRETSMNFGDTVLLNEGMRGETTVLNASMVMPEAKKQPYLIRTKTGEEILLNKPVFRIGKEKSYVDYFVHDNSAISRSHANIVTREDEYFVVDTNSTNHTYVNGTMIQSNVQTKITEGTRIRFANEDFTFKFM